MICFDRAMRCWISLGCACAALTAFGDDHFRSEVVPILASRCVSCHNDEAVKGSFSVQSAESFFRDGHVEKGDAEGSYLIELIARSDGDPPVMPKQGDPLTAEQVDAIRLWIDRGAPWPEGYTVPVAEPPDFDWWSFQPIERPDVPTLSGELADWAQTPIDAFIARSLESAGLSPSPRADRRTLIRRVTYDLTGLPPSWEEIEGFVRDDDPQAYARLVDRLLASPRYGEKWAQHWLDVVKYADTCGYDKDKLRPHAWPYRDYVIRSLNDDKPYAQFVQEQIAGDVLFPGEPDGILGLGFLAAGPWDFIGHVEVPESKIDGQVARNLDRDDMVASSINTFCSLTIQCARCHDHKFDPFTQEHYYGLQAVFAAVDRANRVYRPDPATEFQRAELQRRLTGVHRELRQLDDRIEETAGQPLVELRQQIAEQRELLQAAQSMRPPEFGYHSAISDDPNSMKWVEVVLPEPGLVERIVIWPTYDDFAGIGAGFGFPVRYQVLADGEVVLDRSQTDQSNPGLEPVEVELGRVAQQVRVVAHRLAERQQDYIFAVAELELWHGETNLARHGEVVALDSVEIPVRWAKSNLVDGLRPGDPVAERTAREALERLQTQERELKRSILGDDVLAHSDQLRTQLADLQRQLDELPQGPMVYAAATEFTPEGSFQPTSGKPRPIRLLERGEVTSPGQDVPPGRFPLRESDPWALPIDDVQNEGARRAALALWLTESEHPLFWRSIANRVWQYHLGAGIVATPNDFGRMGAEPSHPELLDWLACELRDAGGSLKHLHRLIVTSAVYQQSSLEDSAKSEVDASNRLYWRMNRRRLSAEEIRDSILLASGQLDLSMGGPGYYLFELEKTEHSPHYEYHRFDHLDPATYRRSIYRFVVRSQPDPLLTTLDCADSSQSTPVRNETQTSLQALALLNNRFQLVMAGHLADHLRASVEGDGQSTDAHEDTAQLVRTAVRTMLGREPTAQELTALSDYAGRHSLEDLARILFNLSEFLYVD